MRSEADANRTRITNLSFSCRLKLDYDQSALINASIR